MSSPRTQFDRTLASFCSQAMDRISDVTLEDADAASLLERVKPLLERALGTLNPAVEASARDAEEAYIASEKRRKVEAEVEARFERLYNMLQARFYTLSATDADRAARFQRDLKRTTNEETPASFVGINLERTEDVFQSTVAFAADALDDTALITSSQKLAERFAKARSAEARESGEASLAMSRLETARDEARRYYLAARDVLNAALLLDGIGERAGQFMRPVSEIYRSSGSSAGEADEAPADGAASAPEQGDAPV